MHTCSQLHVSGSSYCAVNTSLPRMPYGQEHHHPQVTASSLVTEKLPLTTLEEQMDMWGLCGAAGCCQPMQ